MASLTSIDKLKLERMFAMGGGYVLDFNNRTFQAFVLEHTGRDIMSDAYSYGSGSKANRLRAFWDRESNYAVSNIIMALLEYWKFRMTDRDIEIETSEQRRYDECLQIAERLRLDSVDDAIPIVETVDDRLDFNVLAEAIRESISRNQPETALDRLHTYCVKYARKLCHDHALSYDHDDPLHSNWGKYIRFLQEKGFLESEMTRLIMKSSISQLDALNGVRNRGSLAHDNRLLNTDESLLIVKNSLNLLAFVEALERRIAEDDAGEQEDFIPF